MNTQDNHRNAPDNRAGQDELPDALRFQLRALRQDTPPTNDLWPSIADRLQPQVSASPRRRRPTWPMPVALAATLAIAVGAVGLWRSGAVAPTGAPASGAAPATLVQREADGMSRVYQAALQEVAPGRPPVELQPAFDELDRNAAIILDALAHDPDSRLLLEQLRRTYARRLALTQRLAYT